MANHYRLDAASPAIASAFAADAGPDPWAGGMPQVGQFAPVVARGGKSGGRVIRPMHWGYPPPGPMPSLVEGPPRWVPYVRNLESPFWIGNLRHSELRCLIPATAFESGTGKARCWYGLREEPLFAFAGIWRDLSDMPVFAIIATEPSSALLPVEGKGGPASMPLILPRAAHERWLTADWKEAQALVQPYPGAGLEPLSNTGAAG